MQQTMTIKPELLELVESARGITDLTPSASATLTVPMNSSTSYSRTGSVSPSSSMSGGSPRPLKRGRPQQEIEDGNDAGSQRRKHRRLYARQYRAQMRTKVEEVESLRNEVDAMRKNVTLADARCLELQVRNMQLELALNAASQEKAVLTSVVSQFFTNMVAPTTSASPLIPLLGAPLVSSSSSPFS